MSLAGSKSRLAALTKDLIVKWEETKTHWRDAKRDEFERRYIKELLVAMERAENATEGLDKLLAKVRKDCE
jgi:hypothetical protein